MRFQQPLKNLDVIWLELQSTIVGVECLVVRTNLMKSVCGLVRMRSRHRASFVPSHNLRQALNEFQCYWGRGRRFGGGSPALLIVARARV